MKLDCVLQDTINAARESARAPTAPPSAHSPFPTYKLNLLPSQCTPHPPLLIPNRRMIFNKLAWSARPSDSAVLLT